MFNPDQLDQMVDDIFKGLPDSMQGLRWDMDKQLHAALRHVLGKLELVTRDEYEVQKAVLARTREKLEKLQKTVAELEQKLNN